MWTREQTETLRAEWLAGKSPTQIARLLGKGFSRQMVARKAKRMGLENPRDSWADVARRTREARAQITEAARNGVENTELVARFKGCGLHPQTIRNIAYEARVALAYEATAAETPHWLRSLNPALQLALGHYASDQRSRELIRQAAYR